MAPENLEVGLHGVVGRSFFSENRLEVVEAEVAAEFIAFGVCGAGVDTPRSFGVELAGECEVDVVVYCEVVSAIAEIESSVVVIAESGHDYARCIFVGEREVSERKRQWQR